MKQQKNEKKKTGCVGRSSYNEQNDELTGCIFKPGKKRKNPGDHYSDEWFQFKGIVKGFDSYIVILECNGEQNLVYKHAISTLKPTRPIAILDAAEKED